VRPPAKLAASRSIGTGKAAASACSRCARYSSTICAVTPGIASSTSRLATCEFTPGLA
jgi:hypothetical protein